MNNTVIGMLKQQRSIQKFGLGTCLREEPTASDRPLSLGR